VDSNVTVGDTVGDLVLGTETCYLLACEIGPVVGDDGMKKPEAMHNVLPKKFDNLLPCDVERGTASTHLVK